MLTGKCSQDGTYQIDNLSMHKRSASPIEDFFIIMDGQLVVDLENEDEAAETIEE